MPVLLCESAKDALAFVHADDSNIAHVHVVHHTHGDYTFERKADGFYGVCLKNCTNVTRVVFYSTVHASGTIPPVKHIWYEHEFGPNEHEFLITPTMDPFMFALDTARTGALPYIPLVALPFTDFHIELNKGAECDVCFTHVFESPYRRRRLVQSLAPVWYYVGDKPAIAEHGKTLPATLLQKNHTHYAKLFETVADAMCLGLGVLGACSIWKH